MEAMLDRALLPALAELLDYPGVDPRAQLAAARQLADSLAPEARAELIAFVDWAESRPNGELEEIYAATFDSSETCALELGWHVYGETYPRGIFLVEMRQRLREAGIDERSELPDHLSQVLRWLACADFKQGHGEAARVARMVVIPAVRAIVAGLEQAHSPYAPLLRAAGFALHPKFLEQTAAQRPEPASPELEGGCS